MVMTTKVRLRLHALLVHGERDDQHDEGADSHDDNADDDRLILQVRDDLAVLADHGIARPVQPVCVGKARDEQHRDGTDRGADGAPDRQLAALMRIRGHDGGQGPVRDLQDGVGHAEEDVRHGRIDRSGEAVSFFPDPRELDEHQDGGDGQRQRRDQDPFAVAAGPSRFYGIADAPHDRVVDAVPDPRDDEHEHDEERA